MNDYNYIKEYYKNYKTPDGTILSPRENNNLSHFLGGYYLADKYNPTTAFLMSAAKEPWDIFKEIVLKPNNENFDTKFLRKTQDTAFDIINSENGIKLYKQNPYMTDKEVLDFAYKNFIKNYLNKDKTLEFQKEIYGKVLDNNSDKDVMYYYK